MRYIRERREVKDPMTRRSGARGPSLVEYLQDVLDEVKDVEGQEEWDTVDIKFLDGCAIIEAERAEQ